VQQKERRLQGMISHSDLRKLAGSRDFYGLVGDYLLGASMEVRFERDGESRVRTHLILDSTEFPQVRIGVEGSTTSPLVRQFFQPTNIYDLGRWEIADPQDEDALRRLIACREHERAAAEAAGVRELARRRAVRQAEEQEALALRSAGLRAEAALRLVAVWRRGGVSGRQWDAVLQDLNAVLPVIEREADRAFVADLSLWRRRSRRFALSGRQFRWLSDILERTSTRIAAAQLSEEVSGARSRVSV
jgi:hypothetical protein